MKRSWIDQIKHTKELFSNYWGGISSKQKGMIIGTFLFIILSLSTFIFFASRPEYIQLYTGQLSQREVGDIKAELEKQGFTDYKISETGTMVLVPNKKAPDLLVNLASAGFPKDNKINFDIFGENLSFGATDRQYDILEREAMQNKLAKVLTNVEGIQSSEVILTMPVDSVFVRSDEVENASASVMVEVEPGSKLTSKQVKALYTLVSRSVPNLPVENITIMNQYSETLELQESDSEDQSLDKFGEQRKIQQNVERDIQKNLQSLLGTILGTDKVYVHTFVRINFDKVKVQENLVKPAEDSDNGIVVSSEKSSKSFTGSGGSAGGVVGTGEEDVPGYVGSNASGDSSYEELQDKVNYEVNRINNEIIKSPYQIEDITINVGVKSSPDSPNELPQATQENIRNVVANTVRTALGHPEMSQEEIDQRITVFPHAFAESIANESKAGINWLYIVAGAAAGIILVGALIWISMRRKKQNQVIEEEEIEFIPPAKEPDYFAEQELDVQSQLKKLLDQRPEDFSKVIRTWLNDEEA
ncbi:flagellar basal-body MS-ring/collar protein FliF [Neobacillus niacini]|uniref:flagellar basal-body MS-ring/collar protein FliF n=1 Tax=Neobacillus niacini TaxID=86668 RepID=UPI00300234AB